MLRGKAKSAVSKVCGDKRSCEVAFDARWSLNKGAAANGLTLELKPNTFDPSLSLG